MIILGIDPSTKGTGWCILKDDELVTYGILSFKQDTDRGEVLDLIYKGITKILEEYEPEVVVCEDQFVGKNVKTYGTLKEVVGVIRMAVYHNHVPMILYPPTTVKKTVCGKGNAPKEDVAKYVNGKFGTDIKENDITDSIGIGLTYIMKQDE
jgi:crossover junction endodeoxyribonuclease RuvC